MLKIILPLISLILLNLNLKAKTLPIMTITMFLLTSLPFAMKFSNPQMSTYLSIDSLNLPLITLTLWISALMIMASNLIYINKDRYMKFNLLILLLAMALCFSFTLSSFLSFFIFFELSLIPTLMLILGWGYQPERLQAGVYLMMYTLTASLPLLLMISALLSQNFSTSFLLAPLQMNQLMLWAPTITTLMMMMAFMVKMPMFMTHLWLPKAHVEAPVAGSMVLAAILLKLGSYGLLRLIQILPTTPPPVTKSFLVISLIGATLTSLICIRQTDMKSLIAYSSVGHMALLIVGIMSMTSWGWEGALLLMLAHGLCSSALFFLSYSTYTTTQTRSLSLTKGILNFFPYLTLFWFIFSIFNMAAPPSINLASEILLITSTLFMSFPSLMFILLISFLSAVYSLLLYSLTNHGYASPQSNPMNHYSTLGYMTMMLHFIPMLLIMLSPQMTISWT